jgi:outer membrane receptor protein involved in Fe transport
MLSRFLTRHSRVALVVIAFLSVAGAPRLAEGAFSPQTQQPSGGATISGVAQDGTGGVLPQARIDLVNSAGVVITSTSTDQSGRFTFPAISAGAYDIRASFPAFKTASVRVRVGARNPAPVTLVLDLANVQEVVAVGTGESDVSTAASANLSTIAVDQGMLAGLPVMDQDYVAVLSRFLDAGSLGSGGPTLVVNGMEVSALRVSSSAIQQIKINQDPYSAEYGRPGRGRIEILTKPGGQQFHGELTTTARDGRLDSRNAFATTNTDERKRVYDGVFSGPIGTSRKTSLVVSGSYQTDDQQAVVFAAGPSGTIQNVVPQPNTQGLVSASITHQYSPTTIISVTPSYEYEASDNRGVGGTTLPSAGTNFRHHEQQVRYTQQTTFSPKLVNQFQILVGHEREPTESVSPARAVIVAGAFTGGGAQADLVRTEVHMQLNENLSWSAGHHTVQAGFQLPDWSRRGFYDRSDILGSYYFSNLATYAAGQPYAFTQQQGNGDLALLEKQVGAYLKDDWQARPNLTLSLGLRYDWQNYFHDNNNIGPRISVAYAPHGSKKYVLRGGVGLFTDRSGPVILADLLHSERGDYVRYLINDPSYPAPPIAPGATPPRSLTELAPGVQIPRTVQYGVNLDAQLRKGLTLSVGYTGTHGYDLFRSRDINAPLPPMYATRPDPTYGAIRQVESSGRQMTDSLQLTVRGQVSRWFNGQTQYTLSRAWNDTNGLNSYPANDYDLTGEWAHADFDRRHRLVLLGRTSVARLMDIGVGLTANSAGPYTELLGADLYNNGRGRARPPSVARNTLTAAGYAQLDLRFSRELKMGAQKNARAVTLAVDVFNVTNRVNYASYVGTISSPLFGEPVTARPPRQFQFSARFAF